MERYYSLNRFLREKLGRTAYKVCVDAGFSCPNLDGSLSTDGCIYCNNRSFSPISSGDRRSLRGQIEEGVRSQRRRKGNKSCFLAYFQSYTNTYAPVDRLKELYETALSCEGIVGLNISTRPDCLEAEKADLLADLARKHFVLVEIGLQSSHDSTLRSINRGHDYDCFLRAVERIKRHPIYLGAHIILGLPGESESMMLETAERLSALPLDCLKIHNLHVVLGTKLAELYRRDPFPLIERGDYIPLVCRFLERLSPKIAIARLFASTPREMLLAPLWAQSDTRLLEEIRNFLIEKNTCQGRLFCG
jgi:uncharacterized protein